jgi:hypothetical protein
MSIGVEVLVRAFAIATRRIIRVPPDPEKPSLPEVGMPSPVRTRLRKCILLGSV